MPHLTLSLEDGIALVVFDNPPLQVMTPQTMNEVNALLPRLREGDVRVVIFTGAAGSPWFIRHFSVEELEDNTQGAGATWDRPMQAVLRDIEALPKPVIAALNGSAMGGGLEFALTADIRVAKDGPHRFGLPEVSVGILPGAGGTQRLPALIGRGRALNLILRAKLLTPREAFEIGLVEELVAADSSETALHRAREIAREMAGRSPLALAHVKRLVRGSASPVTEEMLALEGRLFADLMASDEAKAGLARAAGAHRAERASGTG